MLVGHCVPVCRLLLCGIILPCQPQALGSQPPDQMRSEAFVTNTICGKEINVVQPVYREEPWFGWAEVEGIPFCVNFIVDLPVVTIGMFMALWTVERLVKGCY